MIAPTLAAVAALVLGFIPAGLTFGLRKNAAQEIGLSVLPVPAWVFIGIWAIIYPTMGIAAWRIAASGESSTDTTVATIVLVAGFLQSIAFWFTDSLRSTAVMDATGVLLSITAAAVLALTTPSAAAWLLPWLVWMPTTLGIKLIALRRANKQVVRTL